MEKTMRSKFTYTQIHQILKEADLGTEVKEICCKYGISRNTFYNWKNRYGSMTPSDAKIKHDLEIENRRLKRMVAERDLEIEAMKELLSKKW
jgi:putative transposase